MLVVFLLLIVALNFLYKLTFVLSPCINIYEACADKIVDYLSNDILIEYYNMYLNYADVYGYWKLETAEFFLLENSGAVANRSCRILEILLFLILEEKSPDALKKVSETLFTSLWKTVLFKINLIFRLKRQRVIFWQIWIQTICTYF